VSAQAAPETTPAGAPADPLVEALAHVVPLLERIMAGVGEQAAALVKLEESVGSLDQRLADVAAGVDDLHRESLDAKYARAFAPAALPGDGAGWSDARRG
jgi:hypothetical protein